MQFLSSYLSSSVFYTELEQIISHFVWKYKKPRIAKAILRKKNDTLSLTKEARIYNGVKTISLTSGAGKIGQPLVK